MAKEYDWYFRLLPPHYADVSNPAGLYRSLKGIIDFEVYTRGNKWEYTDRTKDYFEGNIELEQVSEEQVVELLREKEFDNDPNSTAQILDTMYKENNK